MASTREGDQWSWKEWLSFTLPKDIKDFVFQIVFNHGKSPQSAYEDKLGEKCLEKSISLCRLGLSHWI